MQPQHTVFILLLLFSTSALSADRIRSYPVEQITDNTYVIHGPRGFPSVENQGFMNNPGFVVTAEGVVLIDPGSSVQAGRMVLDQIRTITDKPVTHVINTHVHGDHWLGNQAVEETFPNARLMAHPQMIKRAHESEAAHWLNLMEESTGGFTAGTRAVIPSESTSKIGQFETGGINFRFHAPEKAHSGTDVMIEVIEESVVFLGDNVLNQRIARMNDATFKGNINACDVAIELGATHYVPGHGPTGGIAIVREFRRYLATLYSEVERYYEEDLSDYEMKPKIIPKLKPFNTWVNFNDEVGRHISLALLEVEERAF